MPGTNWFGEKYAQKKPEYKTPEYKRLNTFVSKLTEISPSDRQKIAKEQQICQEVVIVDS